MIVVMEIDLTKDQALMALCRDDAKIVAMLRYHNSLDDDEESETYLKRIGRDLWTRSRFVPALLEHCGDELHDLRQTNALLFTVRASRDSACMFRMACHAPGAVTIK
jgi:hypothetical protein